MSLCFAPSPRRSLIFPLFTSLFIYLPILAYEIHRLPPFSRFSFSPFSLIFHRRWKPLNEKTSSELLLPDFPFRSVRCRLKTSVERHGSDRYAAVESRDGTIERHGNYRFSNAGSSSFPFRPLCRPSNVQPTVYLHPRHNTLIIRSTPVCPFDQRGDRQKEKGKRREGGIGKKKKLEFAQASAHSDASVRFPILLFFHELSPRMPLSSRPISPFVCLPLWPSIPPIDE